jgi:hypothetical protein
VPAETQSHRDTTRTTEITVTGANCPWCFNETLDLLRREPGVIDTEATMAGQCLRVRHRAVAVDRLLAVIRGHLHGDETSSHEHVMIEIDAQVGEPHCTHHPGRAEAHDV